MRNDLPDLFDAADERGLPARSTLYRLTLEGVGTGFQESLLSYLHRLGSAHHLKIKDLLRAVVLPDTDIRGGTPCGSRFMASYARTVNGYGKYATELCGALKRLTGASELDRGTFLRWRGLFDGKGAGLLYSERRWCPSCIAEATGEAHVQFLAWTCFSITHCSIHGCVLVERCVRCHSRQAQISDCFSLGRCGTCGSSLGWKSGLFEEPSFSDRQRFISKAVDQMLSAGPEVEEIATPERLAQGLRHVAQKSTGGVVAHLAHAIKWDPKVFERWMYLDDRPRFDSFLELCYRLDTMPVDLLSGTVDTPDSRLRPGSPPPKRPFHRLSSQQLKELKAKVVEITSSESVYVPARQVAASFNTTTQHFRYRLPDEYAALVAHYLRVRSIHTRKKQEERLETARRVARELVEEGTHVPRRRLGAALAKHHLSILHPGIRAAADEEILRSRAKASIDARDLTARPKERKTKP